MKVVGPEPGASRGVELQTVLRAEREGLPFLVGRDGRRPAAAPRARAGRRAPWVGRGAASVEDLPHNQERTRLAEPALPAGVVSDPG